MRSLEGSRVLVAGAGLAGLTAAVELRHLGCDVTIVEARRRVGGRVLTWRTAGGGGPQGELGGDLIDEDQRGIRELANAMGLQLTPVLEGGFAFLHRGNGQRRRVAAVPDDSRTRHYMEELVRAFDLAEGRWDSAIAEALARRSVTEWLNEVGADESWRARTLGFRGFFLADPGQLSLLAFVEQFTSGGDPSKGRMYRIRGGNDCLPRAMAERFAGRLHLGHELVKITQDGTRVLASVRVGTGELQEIESEFAVLALPTTTLRHVEFSPRLPDLQRDAIERLRYGRATKVLLHFDSQPWRQPGGPLAFATDLPIGAVWDASEDQPGPDGLLTVLAGGSISTAVQAEIASGGMERLRDHLTWLHLEDARLLGGECATWEDDVWARGGYAYFDPGFDPPLRAWLARPHGRVTFAGEHTSYKWQGYMNGAVESGQRAVMELRIAVAAGSIG